MTSVIVAVIAAAVISVKNKKNEIKEIPVMKSYAVVVSSMKAKKEPITLTLPYVATVMSDRSIIVSSRMAARIVSMANSGTAVQKGETVVKLDTRDLEDKQKEIKLQIDSTKIELQAKETALQTAKATHARTKELMKVKAASKERFDTEATTIKSIMAAKTALGNKIKILQLNLSTLNTSLSYANIKATQDGTVSKTFVNTGEMAMPGKPLLEIEGEGGKYLLLRMAKSSNALQVIFENKTYRLTPVNHTFNGLLEYRSDLETDHVTGERISLSLITYKDVGIKLPLNALLQKGGKSYCFVIKGHQTEEREIEILERGENAVVVSGIQEGEALVLAKPDLLLQILGGKPVSIKNERK